MTYLDAAHEILKQAGQPLHYQEITQQVLAQQLISPQGLTPEATMGSRLYTDTLQEGSRFVRAGKGAFGLVQWQPEGIEAQVEKLNDATRAQLHGHLFEMPPDRFEALVGELLIRMGFDESTVQVTKRSGDGGIDVVGVYRATGLTGVSAAVQVKRWKSNVGAPTVTTLRGSLQVHQQGIIITTSDFSRGARTEATAANKTHIGLINGQELVDLLVKHKVGVRERNLPVLSLDDDWWRELGSQSPGVTPQVVADEPPVVDEGALPDQHPPAARPARFVLLGETYPLETWRGMMLTACAVLAGRHADFAEVAVSIRGRSRQHIAASPDGMIDPLPIAGVALWVEANQSGRSAVRIVERLLSAFGYSKDDFRVES